MPPISRVGPPNRPSRPPCLALSRGWGTVAPTLCNHSHRWSRNGQRCLFCMDEPRNILVYLRRPPNRCAPVICSFSQISNAHPTFRHWSLQPRFRFAGLGTKGASRLTLLRSSLIDLAWGLILATICYGFVTQLCSYRDRQAIPNDVNFI